MVRLMTRTILMATIGITSIHTANAESVATQKGATLTIKGTPDTDGIEIDVGGTTDIRLSNTADDVEITHSTFARGFVLDMRGGIDDLNFDSRASRFESTMFVNGGNAGDAVIVSELVVFEIDPVFKNVEQQS
ncbi:MAG: hypothetical protein IPH13_15240 [Planctomycetes bacterium]|nr:hypothetical protein [Planctomycetota bacterium]MCC7172126.1 hypothetical protein [Planctomycetota bacterium]